MREEGKTVPTVTDEMVDRAWRAYQDFGWSTEQGMRYAVEAAFAASRERHVTGLIAEFEEFHPEFYWHIAKGKICAGEPLYGAAIFNSNNVEMGHGESDDSADEAFRIAIDAATNRARSFLTKEKQQ